MTVTIRVIVLFRVVESESNYENKGNSESVSQSNSDDMSDSKNGVDGERCHESKFTINEDNRSHN